MCPVLFHESDPDRKRTRAGHSGTLRFVRRVCSSLSGTREKDPLRSRTSEPVSCSGRTGLCVGRAKLSGVFSRNFHPKARRSTQGSGIFRDERNGTRSAGGQLSDGSWRHANGILPAGDTAYPSLAQVYLQAKATNEDMEAIDGNNNGTLDILVLSQAVQAAGFDSAAEALDSAFGKSADNVADWFGGENIPVTVTSFDDMKAALDAGETDVVVKGAAITENPFNGRYYKDRNIDFVDCTFTANMNYMYINNATFTNCTFDCGSANAAVHYDELFGDLVFNNCTFVSGKIQIGANKEVTGTVTFNDCEFAETASTSIWSEKGIRVYSPAEFNNCEFNNRVVMAGANGLSIAFNSCTMNGGSPVYYVDNTDGIIRGGNVPSVSVTN